jgi:hypothetical protein
MSRPLTEESFRRAVDQECHRIDSKYTIYKVGGIFSIIIAVIILFITIIWALKIPEWLKWISSGILSILILYLGILILRSALVSSNACY